MSLWEYRSQNCTEISACSDCDGQLSTAVFGHSKKDEKSEYFKTFINAL